MVGQNVYHIAEDVFQRRHTFFPFFTEGHGTLETDGEHERRPDHGDTSWTDHDDVQSALLLSGRHVDVMMLSREGKLSRGQMCSVF